MQASQPRILNEKFSILDEKLLGKGSTGNVYLGIERNQPHNKVAIKAINLKEIDNQVTRYLLSCQIAALNNLGKMHNTSHQNIVKLLDIVIQENYIYLIMELLDGGTLAAYIQKNPKGLLEEDALLIFHQILQGYRHMRLKQVIHRDLKPDNILFKTNPDISKRVSIIDFGYCEMQQVPNKPQIYYNVGSPKYMAPQAYKQNYYSQKSDIWSIGVMLYEMLLGRTCDHGMTMQKYLQMVQKQGVPFPDHINGFIRELLSAMLKCPHQSRLNCEQVLKQLDNYQIILNKQRSQIQLFRESINPNELRSTHQFPPRNQIKNNTVFRSLIVGDTAGPNFSRPKNSTIKPFQINLPYNDVKQIQMNDRLISQRKIANKKFLEGPVKSEMQISQNLKRQASQIFLPAKIQNTEFDSVNQIIHRKTIGDGFHSHSISQNFHPNNSLIIQPSNGQISLPVQQNYNSNQYQQFSKVNIIANDMQNKGPFNYPRLIQNRGYSPHQRQQIHFNMISQPQQQKSMKDSNNPKVNIYPPPNVAPPHMQPSNQVNSNLLSLAVNPLFPPNQQNQSNPHTQPIFNTNQQFNHLPQTGQIPSQPSSLQFYEYHNQQMNQQTIYPPQNNQTLPSPPPLNHMLNQPPSFIFNQRRQERFISAPTQQSNTFVMNNSSGNMDRSRTAQQMDLRLTMQKQQKPMYHSPDKKLITVASKIQFYTNKKNNTQENIHQTTNYSQRPIINLRPGQMKQDRGYIRLQPQLRPQFRMSNQFPISQINNQKQIYIN